MRNFLWNLRSSKMISEDGKVKGGEEGIKDFVHINYTKNIA
jgi:hypothetical protein